MKTNTGNVSVVFNVAHSFFYICNQQHKSKRFSCHTETVQCSVSFWKFLNLTLHNGWQQCWQQLWCDKKSQKWQSPEFRKRLWESSLILRDPKLPLNTMQLLARLTQPFWQESWHRRQNCSCILGIPCDILHASVKPNLVPS